MAALCLDDHGNLAPMHGLRLATAGLGLTTELAVKAFGRGTPQWSMSQNSASACSDEGAREGEERVIELLVEAGETLLGGHVCTELGCGRPWRAAGSDRSSSADRVGSRRRRRGGAAPAHA